jgi:uncharacterized protein
MRRRLWVFFSILFVLILYTGLNLALIWPEHKWLAWGLMPPFFTILIGWQFLYRSRSDLVEEKWFYGLAWVGSLSMGLWATFILLTIPMDIVDLFASLFDRFREVASGRDIFLSHTLPLAIVGISGGITTVGFAQALRGPRVKEIRVPIEGLPNVLSGLSIAQISDLHVGPTIGRKYVEDVVKRTNALNPDLIVLTGDLVDGSPEVLSDPLEPIRNLKAKYGVFFVTGNHDYYWGGQAWVDKFRNLGILPLINENAILNVGDSKFLLAGVTDPVGEEFLKDHKPDMAKASRIGSDVKCDLKILLSHRPDCFPEAEKAGFNLQLSGHTHAGQFFPWNLIVGLAYKYYRGLNQHEKLWLYVNPGTGYWGPPHRFLVPSEITRLTIVLA